MVTKASRITIAFTRFAEPNWLVRETIDALSRQERVAADVLFLDQQDDAEMRAYHEGKSNGDLDFQYIVIPAVGSSYARNQGLQRSANDIVLFTDPDAVADPLWAYHMQKSFEREKVAVVGSRVVPKWHKRPLFIARSPMVRRIYALLDHGDGEIQSTDLWGVGFAMHRGRLGSNAYWDERIGRSGGNLLSGEDIEICLRARQMGLETVYNGAAVVQHQVLPERISYRWVMRRYYYAGAERALTHDSMQPSTQGRVLMDYVAYTLMLPAMLLGYWRGRRILAQDSARDNSDTGSDR
jgi:GT2 family glycosyltransferase